MKITSCEKKDKTFKMLSCKICDAEQPSCTECSIKLWYLQKHVCFQDEKKHMCASCANKRVKKIMLEDLPHVDSDETMFGNFVRADNIAGLLIKHGIVTKKDEAENLGKDILKSLRS